METLPRGKVLAVGPGQITLTGDTIPIDLVEGDVVRFKSWVLTDSDAIDVLVNAAEIFAKEA